MDETALRINKYKILTNSPSFFSFSRDRENSPVLHTVSRRKRQSGLVDRKKARVSAQLDGEIRDALLSRRGARLPRKCSPVRKGRRFSKWRRGYKSRERSKWNRRSDTHNASIQRLSSFSILPLKVSRLSKETAKAVYRCRLVHFSSSTFSST